MRDRDAPRRERARRRVARARGGCSRRGPDVGGVHPAEHAGGARTARHPDGGRLGARPLRRDAQRVPRRPLGHVPLPRRLPLLQHPSSRARSPDAGAPRRRPAPNCTRRARARHRVRIRPRDRARRRRARVLGPTARRRGWPQRSDLAAARPEDRRARGPPDRGRPLLHRVRRSRSVHVGPALLRRARRHDQRRAHRGRAGSATSSKPTGPSSATRDTSRSTSSPTSPASTIPGSPNASKGERPSASGRWRPSATACGS